MITADTKLTTKKAREKLDARKKPYYVSVEKRLCLGYQARWPNAGRWYGRSKTLLADGKYHDACWRIAVADDQEPADGDRVLSYGQAFARIQVSPTKEHRTSAYTVRDAVERYFEDLETRAGKGPKARQDAEWKLTSTVLSHPVANTPLNALTLGQLKEWRDGMIHRDAENPDVERRSKDNINRIIGSFKAALNLALEEKQTTGVVNDTEWRILPKFGDVGAARTYHFSIGEVTRLIAASRQLSENQGVKWIHFAYFLEAGFHTGARPGELINLNVGDFEPLDGTLRIERGKTKLRYTALTNQGIEFFTNLAGTRPADEPLIVGPDGGRWTAEYDDFMHTALDKAKIKRDQKNPKDRPCFYSIRHAYVGRSLELGMESMMVASNIGTSLVMLEKNYAKFFAKAKQEHIEQYAPKLPIGTHATA